MGLLGCLLVVVLIATLSLKILSNASGAKDTLGRLICIGVFALIVFHTTVNIGMVLGIAPVIGIPLPFFSAGGTSGMCLFAAIGLVLSVSYHNSTKYRMFYTERIKLPTGEKIKQIKQNERKRSWQKDNSHP